MSDDVGAQIARLYERLAHLEGIIERSHRQGTVTDVDYSDATKPRARIQIGTDDQGQPVKGPWVAIASFAGKRAIHAPVTVGQQMMQVAPDGNFESALLIPYGFSKPIPSPSTDPNTHVDQFGELKETRSDGMWSMAAQNAAITVANGKVTINATEVDIIGIIKLGSADASRPLSLKGSVDSAGATQQSNLSTKVMGV